MSSSLVSFVALLVGSSAAVAAAQSTLGTIRGTVRDAQVQVVARAAVLVVDEDTGVPRATENSGSPTRTWARF